MKTYLSILLLIFSAPVLAHAIWEKTPSVETKRTTMEIMTDELDRSTSRQKIKDRMMTDPVYYKNMMKLMTQNAEVREFLYGSEK